jgi:cytochrome P450
MAMDVSSYDPFDPQTVAEPFAAYRWLLEHAPCHYSAERDIYVLSRYDDVKAALSDTIRYSSTQGVGYERRPAPMMIAMDPPDHTRLRRIVASRFTPRSLARWNERIEAIAERLIASVLEQGSTDIVGSVAMPFPVQVIAEMMGVPFERAADFKRWSDATVLALSGAVDLTVEERASVEATIMEFAGYFVGVIQERGGAAADSDDLISLLLRPSDDGERLDEMEVVSFCVLLLVAGNETTTHLIGNTIRQLCDNPADWRALRDEPGRVPAALEESLRHQAPIQGFFRNMLAPLDVAGHTIPQDSKVLLLYGAANRDPRKFGEPDAYRIARNPTEHIAFGFGPHTCLGVHLARLETRALFTQLVRKLDGIELVGEPVRTTNPLLRGYERLPVRVRAR